MLFVGTLDYFPNADAAAFLCKEIVPRLRASLDRPLRVRVVGAQPTRALRTLARGADVEIAGFVTDVTDAYRDADVVVVPLRVGGGTRIKVLEAFAHGRPVVTTTAGVDGIDARDGEHLVVADDPDAFAGACARLLRDRELAAALTGRARRFVGERHSIDAVHHALARSPAPAP